MYKSIGTGITIIQCDVLRRRFVRSDLERLVLIKTFNVSTERHRINYVPEVVLLYRHMSILLDVKIFECLHQSVNSDSNSNSNRKMQKRHIGHAFNRSRTYVDCYQFLKTPSLLTRHLHCSNPRAQNIESEGKKTCYPFLCWKLGKILCTNISLGLRKQIGVWFSQFISCAEESRYNPGGPKAFRPPESQPAWSITPIFQARLKQCRWCAKPRR